MWNVYVIKSEEMGPINLGLGNDDVIKSKEMECLYDGIWDASGGTETGITYSTP